MDRETAKRFVKAVIAATDQIDAALRLAVPEADGDDWKLLARPVGELHGVAYCDILMSVYRQHPGLEREVETELGNPYP
ncbi:hypothetical protein [Rhabdaerophilum sp. SD176]|uniref:hypothetical protein n=1 Tax=Rhabdaerophilum sp. SD176 TaxID=2983548 RepID=UPI0024DF8438|nr:hypothetical protein [Rhabdaerophilum sp. SD176]